MNELVYLKNDKPVCSSLQVAEKFGKRHTHVIERIEKIIENDSTENSAQCFKASIYKDSTGKSNKMYVMDRDGFTFLVMYKEAVQNAVKDALKGKPPKAGNGGDKPPMTKGQILAVKNPSERQKLIAENITLFR